MLWNLTIDLVSKPWSWSVAMGTSAALVRPGSPRSGTQSHDQAHTLVLQSKGSVQAVTGSRRGPRWRWPSGKPSRQRWKPVIWLGTIASSIQTTRIFWRWAQIEPC
jgi:hypothetical protein